MDDKKMMISGIILSSLLTHSTQSALTKQELPLTPEGVSASIELLAKSSFSDSSLFTFDPAFQKKLSKELVRLNQASEETIRRVGDVLLRPMDELADRKLLFCRLLFILRYYLRPGPRGYEPDDFYKYHQDLAIPINIGGLEEYKDYPTLVTQVTLTLSRSDYYNWPWKRTPDGWQLRWFTYRLDSGMQSYEYMYKLFRKLPLREDVNVKKRAK